MAIRNKCPHCSWPISLFTRKCPNCKLQIFPEARGGIVTANLLGEIITRPFLIIVIVVSIIAINILGKNGSPESINSRADRILKDSGVEMDDTICVEDFTGIFNSPSHPYIDATKLSSNEKDELSNVSKRNNPELYEEIENKYKKIFDDWINWRYAMKLNQKYLALLNCNSIDKRPQDLQDMKNLGLEMQKIIPEIYEEFPSLKF